MYWFRSYVSQSRLYRCCTMVWLIAILAWIPAKYRNTLWFKLLRVVIVVSSIVGPIFFFTFGPGRLLLIKSDPIDEDLLIDGSRLCPKVSPLLGKEANKIELGSYINLTDIKDVEFGGKYRPEECRSRHKVAIIVPYRNRGGQLPTLLNYLHPFLQRQQLDYGIFVVEQSNSSAFNRGMLMNIGFLEAMGTGQFYSCLILHDVDLIPEYDENVYSCPESGRPRQLAFAMSYNKYKVTDRNQMRGVTAITTSDFARLNGFSNSFWGWGGEDDDLYHRVQYNSMTLVRYPQPLGRYTMLSHAPSERNPDRLLVLRNDTRQRSQYDGLNDLVYQRVDLQLKPLYTHILVDIKPFTYNNYERNNGTRN